jgi:Uma2 family endonuclease
MGQRTWAAFWKGEAMSSPAILEPPAGHLLAVEGDDTLYEVVNGQRVEKPPMSAKANLIAFTLAHQMQIVAEPNNLGRAGTEIIFLLDAQANLQRRPDAFFLSFERWPANQPIPDTDPWPVVPNLAVEVISPSNLANAVQEKLEEYFQAGVERVWVVYPRWKRIYVYESPTSVRILTAADTLDGGPVLPGFQLPLANLFR